jgi:hypothetical protein
VSEPANPDARVTLFKSASAPAPKLPPGASLREVISKAIANAAHEEQARGGGTLGEATARLMKARPELANAYSMATFDAAKLPPTQAAAELVKSLGAARVSKALGAL